MANYIVAQLDQISAVQCPCGLSRRAFVDDPDGTATMHMTDISQDARVHYHKKSTELYLVIEGGGHLELDGERVPVRPWTAVLIKPGCRHRAVGKMQIIVVAIPAFDAEDEWFDGPEQA